MITVTIRELDRAGRTLTMGARTDDPCEAIGRVIRRVYGAKAGFHHNVEVREIRTGVITWSAGVGCSAVGPRVRIDVE